MDVIGGGVRKLFAEAYGGCADCVIPIVFTQRKAVANLSNGWSTLLDEVWRGCLMESGCSLDEPLWACRGRESRWSQIVSAMVATGHLSCSSGSAEITQRYMQRYGYQCVSGVWHYGGVVTVEL